MCVPSVDEAVGTVLVEAVGAVSVEAVGTLLCCESSDSAWDSNPLEDGSPRAEDDNINMRNRSRNN